MLHKEQSFATYAFICKSTTFRRFSKDFENKSSNSKTFDTFLAPFNVFFLLILHTERNACFLQLVCARVALSLAPREL